ncbi:MAG: efflux RND transporter periplasmic adaptor subunit [Bacteroidota bacterium]|jgi:RND family efflux transporter MFP subunit
MKKIIGISVVILVIAGVIGLLMYNKKQNDAKQKQNVIISAFPVKTTTVKKQIMEENLSMVGTTNANVETPINSETQGRIVAVKINVGDRVSLNQVVARVDDEIKKATFLSASASYEKAKKDLERNEQLYKEKSISDAQMDGIRLAYQASEAQYQITKRQLADAEIKSPMSGIITTKNVEVGNYISPGQPVAYIVDISTIKVKINVSEKDAFKLKPNDKVLIFTDVYPGVQYNAKIKSISTKADEAHTYSVEITLPNNSKNQLRAGMFVRINFTSLDKSEAVTIPRDALIGTIKEPLVYVVLNNVANIRKIAVGREFGKEIEVIGGLQPGEEVVINGQLNLKDGASVKVVK